MNSIYRFTLSFILYSLISQVQAQTYQLTVANAPFVFLENAQDAVEGPWDVPEFQLPIGFDFELFDLTSDTLYSYFNSFGGTFEVNLDEDHLYMLLPFYASLIDRGYQLDSALSPIKYKTEGIPGNQVFTLEFKKAGLFNGLETQDGEFLDYISFQIRLYEDSGDIEFHYGPSSTQENLEVIFDPYIGPLVGLLADADWNTFGGHIGEIILLEGDPLNPTLATDTIPTFLDGLILENTIYRFSRKSSSAGDHLQVTQQQLFFPNPTSGYIKLNDKIANDVIYPVIVLDANGNQVDLWSNKSDISASSFSAGCYYITFLTKDGVLSQKLIVIPK